MNKIFQNKKIIEQMRSGPLCPYIDHYAEQLVADGYTKRSADRMLRLIVLFSRWMEGKRILASKLAPKHITDYLRYREGIEYRPYLGDAPALTRMLKLLKKHDVIAEGVSQRTLTPSEMLLKEYDTHLEKDRCLALATRISYLSFSRKFVTKALGKHLAKLSKLHAADVIKFVQRRAANMKPRCAQLMTTALRSFLHFVYYRGNLARDLTACVPSVASWSLSTVPRSIPAAHVKQVLFACNRKNAVGRRDYAILLLLARLGLRSGEVARLKLEDIEWKSGCITIHGKAGRTDQLPVPPDVGKAIAAYLRDGRPKISGNRFLFLRTRAPLAGFKDQQSVGAVVKRALLRAGIVSPRNGAHQFRHALASEMLRQGCSLSEIGEILRHERQNTTAIYAKVDLTSLRMLAQPWPGGEQ